MKKKNILTSCLLFVITLLLLYSVGCDGDSIHQQTSPTQKPSPTRQPNPSEWKHVSLGYDLEEYNNELKEATLLQSVTQKSFLYFSVNNDKLSMENYRLVAFASQAEVFDNSNIGSVCTNAYFRRKISYYMKPGLDIPCYDSLNINLDDIQLGIFNFSADKINFEEQFADYKQTKDDKIFSNVYYNIKMGYSYISYVYMINDYSYVTVGGVSFIDDELYQLTLEYGRSMDKIINDSVVLYDAAKKEPVIMSEESGREVSDLLLNVTFSEDVKSDLLEDYVFIIDCKEYGYSKETGFVTCHETNKGATLSAAQQDLLNNGIIQ